MAVTVASRDSEGAFALVPGSRRQTVALVTFDSSYPTGGESVSAASLGLNFIDFVAANNASSSTGPTALDSVPVKQTDGSYKLRLHTSSTGAEVANASDQSAVTVEILAVGR